MDEHLSRILSVLSDGSVPPAAQDVEAVTKRYDFFYLPAVLALRHGAGSMDAGLRQRLIEQIAMNCPDPRMGFMLTDVAYEEWAHFYPACRAEVNTSDAISKFLETYGRYDPREEALLERLIFNPAPDYSSMLAREEESDLPTVADAATADNPQDALINSFILKHKDDETQLLPREQPRHGEAHAARGKEEPVAAEEHHAPSHAASPAYDSSLSESLAKIYIRQKRYDKAFEIIHTLSLNNPKKSAYFADQLRFLRKLMLNREAANYSK